MPAVAPHARQEDACGPAPGRHRQGVEEGVDGRPKAVDGRACGIDAEPIIAAHVLNAEVTPAWGKVDRPGDEGVAFPRLLHTVRTGAREIPCKRPRVALREVLYDDRGCGE